MGAAISRIWSGYPCVPSRVIETKSGRVQGKTFILEDGKEVDAFLGIPYGKPPIGEMRFKVGLILNLPGPHKLFLCSQKHLIIATSGLYFKKLAPRTSQTHFYKFSKNHQFLRNQNLLIRGKKPWIARNLDPDARMMT